MANYLTKSQILAALDLPREEVEVPEWGGTVIMQGLSAKSREAYEASQLDMEASGPGGVVMRLHNPRTTLVALSLVGEDGKPLYSTDEIDELSEKSSLVIERLFDVAARLCGLAPQAGESARKNS